MTKEEKEKYIWVGFATLSFLEETDSDNKIGGSKVKLLKWLFENRNVLPNNVRQISWEAGFSKSSNAFSSTVRSTLKVLSNNSLIEKVDGKYSLIMPK